MPVQSCFFVRAQIGVKSHVRRRVLWSTLEGDGERDRKRKNEKQTEGEKDENKGIKREKEGKG